MLSFVRKMTHEKLMFEKEGYLVYFITEGCVYGINHITGVQSEHRIRRDGAAYLIPFLFFHFLPETKNSNVICN